MNIDLLILAALGLFAALGYRSGAIQQLSHWIGLAAAFLCAKPLAAAAAPLLAERMGWQTSPTAVGLSTLSMPVILIGAALGSRALLNAVIPGDQRNTPDRLAGIVLGAGKAGVIAWAALSAVLAFEQPLAQNLPGAKAALGASSAAAFTREHPLFASAPPSALEKLRSLAAMRDDPKLAALLKDPAINSLLNDPALKQALEKGEPSALLKNPQLKKLLEENPELAKKLEAIAPR